MLLLVPLTLVKEVAGTRWILWNISLGQFAHMISSTGFPLKKRGLQSGPLSLPQSHWNKTFWQQISSCLNEGD